MTRPSRTPSRRCRHSLVLFVVATSVLRAPTALAEDLSAAIYDDMKWIVEEVITRELSETAFPNLVCEYPHVLAFFPRVSQRIYARQLNDLEEAVRADIGEQIVLFMALERAHLDNKGNSVAEILRNREALTQLAEELSCLQPQKCEHGAIESCEKRIVRTREFLTSSFGHASASLECNPTDNVSARHGIALRAFRTCIQGAPDSDSWCATARSLAAYARRDRPELLRLITEAAAKSLRTRLSGFTDEDLFDADSILEAFRSSSSTGDQHFARDLDDRVRALETRVRDRAVKNEEGFQSIRPQLALLAELRRIIAALMHLRLRTDLSDEAFAQAAYPSLRSHVLGGEFDALPTAIRRAFQAPDASRSRELRQVSSAAFKERILTLCDPDGDHDADALCETGLRFVESLSSYALSPRRDGADRDATRQAFRDAAVDFITTSGADSGIDRRSNTFLRKLLLPRLELSYSISPTYLNTDGAPGTRLVASILWIGWYWPALYTDRHYAAVHASAVDIAAPFAELASRPASEFTNDAYAFALWLRPQVGIHYGMPWLSRHLVLSANASYRTVSAVKEAPSSASSGYRYAFRDPFKPYESLEFGIGVRYIP